MSLVLERLTAIKEEIELRKSIANSVTIVGVTKQQPTEKIREAIGAGLNDFGVNYAQDGEVLLKEITDPLVRWHFIGHIQSRKVRFLSSYNMIESLDRLEIASSLDRRLGDMNRSCEVLVEVNIGNEPGKSGILAEGVENFLKILTQYKLLKLRGLMVMPPAKADLEERRPFFRAAKSLFDRFQSEYRLDTLSMGTSDDYLLAVEEGANMVRLGTVLFGKRVHG